VDAFLDRLGGEMGACLGGTEWATLGVLVGFPVFWGSGS